jgi:hypothetical protein
VAKGEGVHCLKQHAKPKKKGEMVGFVFGVAASFRHHKGKKGKRQTAHVPQSRNIKKETDMVKGHQ